MTAMKGVNYIIVGWIDINPYMLDRHIDTHIHIDYRSRLCMLIYRDFIRGHFPPGNDFAP